MKLLLTFLLLMPLSLFCLGAEQAVDNAELSKTVTIEDFFRASHYDHFNISPNGQLVAYAESLDNEYNIYLYDVNSQKSHKVLKTRRYTTENVRSEYFIKTIKHNNRVKGITWLGDDVIAVRENSKDGFRRFKIIKLALDDDFISVKTINYLHQEGYWLNPLVKRNKFALFAKAKDNEDYDYHVDLFYLNLTKSNLDGQTSYKKRANKRGPKLQQWLTDAKGHRTVGMRINKKKPELFIRSGNKPSRYRWSLAWTGDDDDYFEPVFYDKKNATLYVITNHNSDKKRLQLFDLEAQKLTQVVYSHPKYDINGAVISADETRLLGVSIFENGFYKQHFFAEDDNKFQSRLKQVSGSENSYLMDVAKSNNNRLFNVSDSDNSGEVFIYNGATDKFQSLVKLKPWLKDTSLQKSALISLTTADDSSLEAFITLPQNAVGEVPLLVIPHGGPIGVSDLRHYSADIQVLVNAGFATLQVNYRGSAGYGKKFRQQGMGQWGELIEDDIELALNYAKENYRINPNKVCIVGSSYGGYSALFSIIRSPQLYQCAASFAGVTDLALLFQRSDIENDDEIKKQLRRIVGDPDKEQAKLFKYSPVYRAEELRKPLFIAHGTDDDIVDIEHAYRLKFALKAHEIPFKWSILDGVAHGFDTTKQADEYYSQLIAFLNEHLK